MSSHSVAFWWGKRLACVMLMLLVFYVVTLLFPIVVWGKVVEVDLTSGRLAWSRIFLGVRVGERVNYGDTPLASALSAESHGNQPEEWGRVRRTGIAIPHVLSGRSYQVDGYYMGILNSMRYLSAHWELADVPTQLRSEQARRFMTLAAGSEGRRACTEYVFGLMDAFGVDALPNKERNVTHQ